MKRLGNKHYVSIYPPKPPRALANLEETSKHYNIDRIIIRRTVARYIDFPRITVGGHKRGWSFNLDDIDNWLKKNEWYRGERAPTPEVLKRMATRKANKMVFKKIALTEDAPIDPNQLPPSIQKLRDKMLVGDQRAAVQTKLLQLELDKKMGVLVDREDIVSRMSMVVSMIAKQLEMMPNAIGKKFELDDEIIRAIRDYIDQMRNSLFNGSENALSGKEISE